MIFNTLTMKSAFIATTFAVAASAGTLKTKPGGAVWDEETAVSVLPWKQGRWGGGVGVTARANVPFHLHQRAPMSQSLPPAPLGAPCLTYLFIPHPAPYVSPRPPPPPPSPPLDPTPTLSHR